MRYKDKVIYHFIYIPGLGDNLPNVQRKAVSIWRLYGVEAELLQMRWDDTEPWEAKLQRLLDRIDTEKALGKRVVLVGASAGAAAVINGYAARRDSVAGCVLIAGKVNSPDTIGAQVRAQYPAFVTAAYACEAALRSLESSSRARILSVYALFDNVVSKADSYVTGARNHRSPSVGHALTIGFQLLLGAPWFIRAITSMSDVVDKGQ